MAGGGKAGETKEDQLDKGDTVYLVRCALTDIVQPFQQNVLGKGKQSDESALEQAKDEQISDFIRREYQSATGTNFPVAGK